MPRQKEECWHTFCKKKEKEPKLWSWESCVNTGISTKMQNKRQRWRGTNQSLTFCGIKIEERIFGLGFQWPILPCQQSGNEIHRHLKGHEWNLYLCWFTSQSRWHFLQLKFLLSTSIFCLRTGHCLLNWGEEQSSINCGQGRRIDSCQ